METVKELRIKLFIKTEKREVVKEFSNLFDLKIFMDSFFSEIGDRRSGEVDT